MTITTNSTQSTEIFLRHTLATLSYRTAKALRGAPPEFSSFRLAEGSRSAGEILAHMSDLFDWALSQMKGNERWYDSQPQSWAQDSERFFAIVTAFDDYLASGAELHATCEKVFQGAIADALTHTGQIAMLRRLAGAQIRGENYYNAKIETGRTGADQHTSVMEFD